MRTSLFEKQIENKIRPFLAESAPGLQVQAFWNGRKICDLSMGDTYPYYDLASLTKVIFTVQAAMKAFDQGLFKLEDPVSKFVGWYSQNEDQKKTTIKDLLTHTSGLEWWSPFYKSAELKESRLHRWTETARMIREMKLDKTGVAVYSDVGFILLGHTLESIYDRPLLEIWNQIFDEFYPGSTFAFNPDHEVFKDKKHFAPTERCPWRGKIVQGEVHDENAWSVGGVSSHAGLFGSVDDVSWYGLFLRSQIKGISKTKIRSKTVQLFADRALPRGRGDWGLGFMKPTPGSSSSGKYFSPYSLGHTGFTGTSIWYDPNQDLLVTILSNRVFLGRENKAFAKLRPEIHNWIVEELKRV